MTQKQNTHRKAQHTSRDWFSSPWSTFIDGCVLNFLNIGARFGIPDLKEQKFVFLLWKMFLHISTGMISKPYNLWLYQFHLSSSVHRWHQNYWYQSLTIFGYISFICHLSTDATKIVVSAFVFSCLDHCSSLLPGCLNHLLNNHNFKSLLFTLSWEFPKLAISLLILLLSIGCPLIHEYKLLSLWYNSLSSIAPVYMTELLKVYKPAHQLRCSSNTSILVFPLCGCTCLVRDLFLMLQCLSGTFSLGKFDHQTHSHLSNLTSVWDCVCACVRACMHVCAHMLMEVCFDCVLFVVLYVMSYVLQFRETTLKRVHYYYICCSNGIKLHV